MVLSAEKISQVKESIERHCNKGKTERYLSMEGKCKGFQTQRNRIVDFKTLKAIHRDELSLHNFTEEHNMYKN